MLCLVDVGGEGGLGWGGGWGGVKGGNRLHSLHLQLLLVSNPKYRLASVTRLIQILSLCLPSGSSIALDCFH